MRKIYLFVVRIQTYVVALSVIKHQNIRHLSTVNQIWNYQSKIFKNVVNELVKQSVTITIYHSSLYAVVCRCHNVVICQKLAREWVILWDALHYSWCSSLLNWRVSLQLRCLVTTVNCSIITTFLFMLRYGI